MMTFRITTKINDGQTEAFPLEVTVDDNFVWKAAKMSLGEIIEDEFCNDYGDPFAPGCTILIERIA